MLDNLRSALNVGSIIRTCDALGIKDIYFCGITPDPSNNKVLKTSLGAEKNTNINISKSTLETIQELKNEGFEIVGLELSDKSVDINKYEKKSNIALIVGNEVSGLPEDVINECDNLVQIPMKGIKESLNVATAFGIAAFVLSKLE